MAKWILVLIVSLLLSQISFSATSTKNQTIAILDFEGNGVEQSVVNNFVNKFRKLLIQDTNFQTLERAKMFEILKEQGFQQTGCTSTECAVDVGRLVGVNTIVAGSVGKVGSLYILNARLISVETGKITKEVEISEKTTIENLYMFYVEKLYTDLFGDLRSQGRHESFLGSFITTQYSEKLFLDSLSNSKVIGSVGPRVRLPIYGTTKYYYLVKSENGTPCYINKAWVTKTETR